MLPVLPPASWLEFRGFPSHLGQHKTTHYAVVKFPDGKERKCVVKLINLDASPGLLCEALGWTLAQASGVLVPPSAAILRVPIHELAQSMPLPAWTNGFTEYLAWCVEAVDGKSLNQINRWIFWLARAKCLKARNTPIVAAFDIWADNQDRNYGNVIRSKDGKYISIDHELLLHDLIWRKMFNIEYEERSLLKEASEHLSAERLKKFQVEMATAARQHESSFASTQNDAMEIVTRLLADPAEAIELWVKIEDFLTTRAQNGWMSQQLGVTI